MDGAPDSCAGPEGSVGGTVVHGTVKADPTLSDDEAAGEDGAPGPGMDAGFVGSSQSNPHSRGRTMRLVSRVVREVSQANIHFA